MSALSAGALGKIINLEGNPHPPDSAGFAFTGVGDRRPNAGGIPASG
jgi:hypothetical protein